MRGFAAAGAEDDLHPHFPERLGTRGGSGVGIREGDVDPADARLANGQGTGRGLPIVVARFEGHVERRVAGAAAGGAQGDDFRVVPAEPLVVSLAE